MVGKVQYKLCYREQVHPFCCAMDKEETYTDRQSARERAEQLQSEGATHIHLYMCEITEIDF